MRRNDIIYFRFFFFHMLRMRPQREEEKKIGVNVYFIFAAEVVFVCGDSPRIPINSSFVCVAWRDSDAAIRVRLLGNVRIK